VERLANVRTQLDGFTPAARQMTMALFMEDGQFSSHLRRMRAVYAAKRALLVDGLSSLAARGWSWSRNPAGLHLLVRHQDGSRVRDVAAASSLDLALLSSYRAARRRDDGLLLRFGALETTSLRSGIETLLADIRAVKGRSVDSPRRSV